MGHALRNDANVPTLDAPGTPYPRADELVGSFPNLEILHLVGHGGMGAVYLARQTNLDRMVALKVLSPRLGNDPSFTERFTREARTLARLSHPNIVTVFDYGQTERFHFLIMEYVDGINLRDAIQEGKLTPEESLGIVPQICDALQFAHNEGVIHRDIKPENILLDKHGRVKIADFGLAKLLQADQQNFSLTGTQQVLGTRNYMAPEQIEKPEVVDHRADIYSLGVVFYELLTGELPIGRFAVPSKKAAVPHHLDEVVMRTLEKEPAQRFQQASEIRTAVESVVQPKPPVKDTSPPKGKAGTSGNQRISSLPFSIGSLYGGLAAAHGIAHLYKDRLELEYQVIDDVLGEFKSATHSVVVPLSGLVSIRFVKGMFSDRIEFQSDRLDVAKDVPNSQQGRFSLTTKRADIEQAKNFFHQTERCHGMAVDMADSPVELVNTPVQQAEYRPPTPPLKSEWFGTPGPAWGLPVDQAHVSREQVIEALKIPSIGFLVIGLINLALAIKGFVKGAVWEEFESISLTFIPNVDVNLLIPRFDSIDFSNVLLLIVSIVMLSISSKMRRPRDYTYLYAALVIVMLAPVHLAYVFAFVFAIWSLVVLSDHRCKEVFAGGGYGQVRPRSAGHWVGVAFAAVFGLFGIMIAAGFAFALLAHNRAEIKQPGKPQPIVSTKMAEGDSAEISVSATSEDATDDDPDAESPSAASAQSSSESLGKKE